MLSDRSIKKIGTHLEKEGWTDDEISEALNTLENRTGVVNIALPAHFKEEALQHAKCHCAYVLKIKEGSPKYQKAFEDAYYTYLIEAYENSRGVEGPNSGSRKRANPAGIEVFAFDEMDRNFIPKTEKEELEQKAPAGLIYMGKDKWVQKSIKLMDKELKDKDLVKSIVTQYSAAVVSLSNAFLLAFGGYKTKRRYGSSRIYRQNKEGKLLSKDSGKDAESTMEFSKGQTREEMLQVAYRQITRQIYILTVSSVIAGIMALDKEIVGAIEKGVEAKINDYWNEEIKDKKGNYEVNKPNLAFALKREVRNKIMDDFYKKFNTDILDYQEKEYSERRLYLMTIQRSIIAWANQSLPDWVPSEPLMEKFAKK